MGYNFPDAPIAGEVHGPFAFDGVKWMRTSAGNSFTQDEADALYVKLIGDAMVGPLSAAEYKINARPFVRNEVDPTYAANVITDTVGADRLWIGDLESEDPSNYYVAGLAHQWSLGTIAEPWIGPVLSTLTVEGLTLPAAPTAANHATTKSYVDTAIATNVPPPPDLSGYVAKTGDTMSGGLVTPRVDVTGDFNATRPGTNTGYTFLGPLGNYVGFDGGSIVINGNAYSTGGLGVAGVTTLSTTNVNAEFSVNNGSIWANNGHIFWRSNGGLYLNHDGTNYNLAGSPFFVHSNMTVTGQVTSYSPDSFRIAYGAYGTFWRNDAATLYLMLTNAWDSLGSWSGHRPITVDLASGICNINGRQPVCDGRLAFAGDYTVYITFVEPYGGAVITGTNSMIYRFRYMQLCNTGWWTIGYA